MIVQPELPWSFFNNFGRLIPNGGRPSEKVDRPAGELIDQPLERLERLKLVSRLIPLTSDLAESSFGDVNSARR